MRKWRGVSFALAALPECFVLSGCGSSEFASSVSCPSTTQCPVVLQDPASNSDPSTWTVTASDPRVRIVPSHGVIAPGQMVTVTVTLPPGACGIQLTGSTQDAVWPLGLGGGSGFGAIVPNMVAPSTAGPGMCSSAQATP
jgi:hypothetical protein